MLLRGRLIDRIRWQLIKHCAIADIEQVHEDCHLFSGVQ